MHPACSLHGCLTLQIPRDDPGNESWVSTYNSGTGWVDQMAVGVWALGNSLPHIAQGAPKQIQLSVPQSPGTFLCISPSQILERM